MEDLQEGVNIMKDKIFSIGSASQIFTPNYAPLKRLDRKAEVFFPPHLFSSTKQQQKSHAQILQHLIKNRYKTCTLYHLTSLHLRSFAVLIRPFIT